MTFGRIFQSLPIVDDSHPIIRERQELTNLTAVSWVRLFEISEKSMIIYRDSKRNKRRVIDTGSLIRDQTYRIDRSILLFRAHFNFPLEHVNFTTTFAHHFDGELCTEINHFSIWSFHSEANTFRRNSNR